MTTPRTWSDLTLGQFMELRLGGDIIQVCCGMTSQQVATLTEAEKQRITDRLQFIETTEPQGTFSRTFWHKGKWWRVTDNVNDLTGGQFIDLSTFLKDAENNTHLLLAVICQPLRFGVFKRKYNGKRIFEYADDLLSLPVTTALAISAFFLNSLEIYLEGIPDYLEGMAMESVAEVSRMYGDGILPSTTSVTTTVQSGTTSPTWESSSS